MAKAHRRAAHTLPEAAPLPSGRIQGFQPAPTDGTPASPARPPLALTGPQLGRVCVVLVVLMLIPLVLIALYNYPADDDFSFTLPAAQAWLSTGSLWQVARAIARKTHDIYLTWQGNFVSTALFGITPMVFDIRLYFLDNWAMLALFCLSVAYLVKGVVCRALHAPRHTFWLVYTAALVLGLQFMPSIGYSIYWHNGGQYTTAVCILMLLLGLLIRCFCGDRLTPGRSVLRGVLAGLCGFALGGSFYGPMLGSAVLLVLLTVSAWVNRSRHRWHASAALCLMLAAMVISLSAPGNHLRISETCPPLEALITTVLDSFDVFGRWLSPQLLAMLSICAVAMWQPLRDSSYRFAHPLCVFVAFYGLFSATMLPGVYTYFGYETERYFNAVYFHFLILCFANLFYAEGWLIRQLQARAGGSPAADHLLQAARNLGARYTALFLALVVALTGFGAFANTIMNRSSISATKSLITGEAARFRQEMAERQEYIRVTDSDEVQVRPLNNRPYVFKYDRLPWQGIYGRVRYMKQYFQLFEDAKK